MKIPDFSVTIKKIRFGKTSKSEKLKVECPKCKNTIMIECIGLGRYKCHKCNKVWEIR